MIGTNTTAAVSTRISCFSFIHSFNHSISSKPLFVETSKLAMSELYTSTHKKA